jgi:signal transduction histidine kinase
LIFSCSKNPSSTKTNDDFEKVKNLIKESRKTSNSDSLRNVYLSLANKEIDLLGSDSLKLKSYVSFSYSNLVLGNMANFKKINQKILILASKLKDTVEQSRALADLGYYYQINNSLDSAFYFYRRAMFGYASVNFHLEEGRVLLGMAQIQTAGRDYLGSEISTFKALSKYKDTKEYYSLFSCYYNLGFIANELKNHSKSIEYHYDALSYTSKIENSDNIYLMTINGIGNSYLMQKDYPNAIKYYDKGLDFSEISMNYPLRYARFIDNKAYSNLQLGRIKELPEKFYEALQIRDSLKNSEGIIQSNLNLTKYFIHKKDYEEAQKHALLAKNLSQETKLNLDLLESYKLLAEIYPGEEGKDYLKKHIHLTDSLQQVERITREKFTRIAYETDEIIQEKELETKRKWWITALLGLVAILSVTIILNFRQRSRNKELLFNQQQEAANIEIYNLMISEQTKYQEGSQQEKKRISEELHDGVLGRLFGTRLILDSLSKGNSEEDIEERENCIDELQLIEKDIRKISHNLNSEAFGSDVNFVNMVEQLVEKQSKIGKFDFDVKFNDGINWESITNNIKIHCYRTFQEALQNINKYAKASKVKILVEEVANKLLIEIKDDGVGFDINTKSKGIGIGNIKSRVQRLQGTIEFESKPGDGVLIKMLIPLA